MVNVGSKIEWYERVADYITDNLEDFYATFYNKELIKVGSTYRLNPCPICTHNDSFTVGSAVHCFSCGLSGTHINTLIQIQSEKENKSKTDTIKELEEYTNFIYPRGNTKEEIEKAVLQEKTFEIRSMAIDFYNEKLMLCQRQLDLELGDKIKKITPLQYQIEVRGHKIETLKLFKVGFVLDYLQLWESLINKGFSKEEIKEADIWFPEGVFVYPYINPATKDVVRMNIKNPFKVTMEVKKKDGSKENVVVKGMSTTGEKTIGFAPGFTFRKPAIIVEGENDGITVFEQGFKNCMWGGGQFHEDHIQILEKHQSIIYTCFDNDSVGEKYTNLINEGLPHKDVRKINFDKNYNDIDDYYRKSPSPTSVDSLAESAVKLETDAFKILRDNEVWTIVNRYKKIEFRVSGKDNKGMIIGQISYYVDDQLIDRQDDTSLSKCRTKMRPFNFYLSDAMEQYFNTDIDKKTMQELLDIYWYCNHKSQIIKTIARKAYDSTNYEQLINTIKIKLGSDVCDAVLKEVNDLQNANIQIAYSSIPKITLSNYFNVKNDDAYFYFTNIAKDGDVMRKLPFLLRNDKQTIRLDLLKRKDPQCLLLVDNKYELPFEVSEAVMDLSECSLTQDWAEKYCNNEITKKDINPYALIKTIEQSIKKFYYHVNENVYKVLALFVYGTYYYELFGQYPYLFLNGKKGSGKSILDQVLYMFCLNAKLIVSISDAALFRMISLEGGTMILDELENLTSRNKSTESTMASILKGGYATGYYIYRSNPEKGNVPEKFSSYSPKIISNIFGLDDVIEDRCIRIDCYQAEITKDNKLEDPKRYISERFGEIREVTSKCCLSALEYFKLLDKIFHGELFETGNARLSQILTPIYAIAILADASRDIDLDSNLDISKLEGIEGEYILALKEFYRTSISKTKKEIEENTPEGIIKHVVMTTAKELLDLVSSDSKDYTVPSNHKYTEPIKYNVEEGWFELNTVHLKVFIEEHMVGDVVYARPLNKWMKTVFDFDISDITRKTADVSESEDLLKEWKGNSKPKVNCYRFWFRDLGFENMNNFLKQSKTSGSSKITNTEFQNQFF